jgi:hypothetical protein
MPTAHAQAMHPAAMPHAHTVAAAAEGMRAAAEGTAPAHAEPVATAAAAEAVAATAEAVPTSMEPAAAVSAAVAPTTAVATAATATATLGVGRAAQRGCGRQQCGRGKCADLRHIRTPCLSTEQRAAVPARSAPPLFPCTLQHAVLLRKHGIVRDGERGSGRLRAIPGLQRSILGSLSDWVRSSGAAQSDPRMLRCPSPLWRLARETTRCHNILLRRGIES